MERDPSEQELSPGEQPPEEGDSAEPGPFFGDEQSLEPPTFLRHASDPMNGGSSEPVSPLQPRSVLTADEEEEADALLPRAPRSLVEMGLSKAFLTDLVLKIIHYSGNPSIAQLMKRLGVGVTIIQQIINVLNEERLVEVLSQSDLYTGNYRYRLSERGKARVAEALERTRYAGPAPVTAEQYGEVIRKLHGFQREADRGQIADILDQLVLAPDVADAVARALFSGKAAMLHGPSGNGKTVILERFADDLRGLFVVPYAIYAYGQVIRVFDQSVHHPVKEGERGNELTDDNMDARWVVIKRPAIVLGAEMGQESLDLAYDPTARFYQAPPHIKAQGGLLVVDDFGRQSVSPRDMLTRWLIPLERGWDMLTLTTGEKVGLPFKAQLLLATNQRVRSLADDALLRRIPYKVPLPNPGRDEFREILRRACTEKGVLVAPGTIDHVVQRLYADPEARPTGSYARDILDIIIESAQFDGGEPVLDAESFERAYKLFAGQDADEGAADF